MKKSSSHTKKTVAKKVTKKVAKKAPKKPIVKKVSAQKTSTKKPAKQKIPLVTAPAEQQFWTKDGQILSDLLALAESFSAMDDLLFRYHANEAKNDFAEWVEHVLSDDLCAKSLRKADTPKKAHGVVVRRLRYYHC